ncbi:unnamed protein product, partial [Mycena citricolor]
IAGWPYGKRIWSSMNSSRPPTLSTRQTWFSTNSHRSCGMHSARLAIRTSWNVPSGKGRACLILSNGHVPAFAPEATTLLSYQPCRNRRFVFRQTARRQLRGASNAPRRIPDRAPDLVVDPGSYGKRECCWDWFFVGVRTFGGPCDEKAAS